MAVVDNRNMTKEQEANKDFEFYFNPVLYATLISKPMNNRLESKAIFLTNKAPKGVPVIQAESARTHIATDPNKFLKRIIIVPSEKLETAFVQLKTLDEADVNSNKELAKMLEGYIRKIAKHIQKTPLEVAKILADAQEKSREVIKGKKAKEKEPLSLSIKKENQPLDLKIKININISNKNQEAQISLIHN